MNEKEKVQKSSKIENISRRDFLIKTGAVTAGLTLGGQGTSCEHDPLRVYQNKKVSTVDKKEDNLFQVIDIHRHCMLKPSQLLSNENTVATIRGISAIAYSELMDIDAQMESQKKAGVSKSILSFSMLLEINCENQDFRADEMVTIRVNDNMAGFVAKYPDMLEFMAIVNPFNKQSVKECERCFSDLKAKGINIGTSWRGRYLDSKELDFFWDYVQDRNEALFLHPPFVPIGHEKMNLYKLEEMIGRPVDTAMTISRMIYSGVFDRFPKLKVVLPHMGGVLINIIGRLDYGYRLGYKGLPREQWPVCKRKPSEYLKQNLYVDTMGFSTASIKHCLEVFGVERVLFGSDYAAVPISQKGHVDIIRNLNLSKRDEEMILWRNAAKLFKLV